MATFIFTNNVNTTLAATVSSGATSITLSSSTNLPASIPAGSYFAITLNDAATRQIFEVMYATAVSGATLTVIRGQEGTTAQSWNTGDFAFSCGSTAGQLASFAQVAAVQANNYNYAADTGAVNALAVALSPSLANPPAGTVIDVLVANTNTGAATLAVNGGTAYAITNRTGAALIAGDLVAGDVATFYRTSSGFAYHPTQGRLINVQTFTSSGTYTPTPGMRSVIVEVQSGGGGGGGTATPSSGQDSISAGGQGGNFGMGRFTAATVGASQAITVGAGGAGGAGGASAGANGSPGGQSSFGTLIVQPGGGFGLGGGLYSSSATVLGSGLTVASSTNCFEVQDGGRVQGGSTVWSGGINLVNLASNGGSSRKSSGTAGSGQANGQDAGGNGGGGGGTNATGSTGPFRGGNGSAGIVIIWEYA